MEQVKSPGEDTGNTVEFPVAFSFRTWKLNGYNPNYPLTLVKALKVGAYFYSVYSMSV